MRFGIDWRTVFIGFGILAVACLIISLFSCASSIPMVQNTKEKQFAVFDSVEYKIHWVEPKDFTPSTYYHFKARMLIPFDELMKYYPLWPVAISPDFYRIEELLEQIRFELWWLNLKNEY